MASKPTKQSLGEFKAWLSGVEEMQPESWSPDLSQWRKIRDKIDNIEEIAQSFNSGGAGPSRESQEPARQVVIRPEGPSLMNPAAIASLATTPPSFMSGDGSSKAKTPNIDTSGGGYTSGLE